MKKSIHFILPAGGVRGSFQAGFLYELLTNYKDSISIHKIDCTSVGSINGIILLSEQIELFKEIWFDINNINDFFNNWSNIPLFGTISKIYNCFYKNGVYNNKKMNEKLTFYMKKYIFNCPKEKLKKYSCTVTNVTKGTSEYINGDNKELVNFITASASPWILSNPISINSNLYTDGAILESYPIKFVENSEADLKIIVGFDQESIHYVEPNCSNIFYFLASLIDISKLHSYNTIKVKELIKNNKCIPITNTMNSTLTDFSKKNIQLGFKQGQEMAHLFYKTYLI